MTERNASPVDHETVRSTSEILLALPLVVIIDSLDPTAGPLADRVAGAENTDFP